MIRAETLAAASAENRAIADEHESGGAVLENAPIEIEGLEDLAGSRSLAFMHVLTVKSLETGLSADARVELIMGALAAAWVDGAIVGARAAQLAEAES